MLILKHIGVFIFVVLPLTVLGILVLPITLPFGYVPWAMDNDTPDGRDGPFRPGLTGWRKLLNQYDWLALRNPIHNFKVHKLGVPWTDIGEYPPVKIGFHESQWLGSTAFRGIQYRNGVDLLTGEKQYFELYILYPIINGRGIRIRIGWKFGPGPEQPIAQWVFTIHPFKKIQ